jgi:hypothetical protein
VAWPLLLVVPEAGFIVPQVPEATQFTVSPDTAVPPGFKTVAVNVEVLVPLAATVDAVDDTLTEFGGDDCVIRAVPLPPLFASVAVIVQVPTVLDAVYVVVTWPREFVTPPATDSAPQEPLVLALLVNMTASPETGPLAPVTVAVTFDVLPPSAATVDGLAATVTPWSVVPAAK